jgi:hypothetical protein
MERLEDFANDRGAQELVDGRIPRLAEPALIAVDNLARRSFQFSANTELKRKPTRSMKTLSLVALCSDDAIAT